MRESFYLALFHCCCTLGSNMSGVQYKKLEDLQDKWICINCSGNYFFPAFNSVNAIIYTDALFDFSKTCLPINSQLIGTQFYLHLLRTYLFIASTSIPCTLMWNQFFTHCKGNDVILCLSQYIYKTSSGQTGSKWSTWWVDNYPFISHSLVPSRFVYEKDIIIIILQFVTTY